MAPTVARGQNTFHRIDIEMVGHVTIRHRSERERRKAKRHNDEEDTMAIGEERINH